MKERRTFIDKVKQAYKQHQRTVSTIILVIVIFIDGYLFSWNFLQRPLNDNQLKACKQIARDVYAQNGAVVVDAEEDDFSVNMTKGIITVKSTNVLHRGKVIAKLKNGELVITQDMENGLAIFFSVCIGIAFEIVLFTILKVSKKNQTSK